MPQLIHHIDAIARQKNRAVLYLEFHPQTRAEQRRYDYQADAQRATTIAWLEAHQFGWQPCGPFANPQRMASYLGQIHIDQPYDDALPRYRQLCDFLELPDGSMRHAGVRFYAMSLELARQNSEHDEPGYWEGIWGD